MLDIGARLREIRQSNGLKLINVAEATGLSAPYVSEIERGIKSPTIETLASICAALNVTLSDFFASEAPTLAPSLIRLLQAAERLTEEEREHLTKLLTTITQRSDNHE